jgi:hypothetical protein
VEAVCGEPVRVVRHRDGDVRAASAPFTRDQRAEDLDDRAQGTACEVGDLDGRESRRGVCQQSRPADVVQVVARAPVVCTEAGDRAVDDRIGDVARPDAEPLGDARPEALEHDVGACTHRPPEGGIAVAIPHDRFLAGVERLVPGRRNAAERVSVRRLDAHNARAPLQQLAAREWAGEMAREVRDDDSRKWLHYAA